ncbi:MAG: hypothetical protein JXN59_17220 [Anaerolineae bacterium]|nr:hypothetical protein [Anaerolineae bacterium]
MAINIEGLIREGVSALKAGRKDEAFRLLTRATELDERNADAWLWLSAVVDNLENQQICLENVLAIDPNNSRALQGLNMIQKKLESRAHPVLDDDEFEAPQAAPPPSSAVPPATSPFDLNAPVQSEERYTPPSPKPAGGYHGSGQAVDLPSGSEYDAWVNNLKLGAADEELASPFEQDDDFGYDEFEEPASQPHFDPFAMPAANALAFDDEPDALSELEQFDDDDETLFDDADFEGASPFGMFEDGGEEDYQDEQQLVGYLSYLPADIKPTYLPGQQPLYPRRLLAGLGLVSVGIIAALVVLVLLVV